MLLTTIWIGLAGALLMFAGDMLLYYTPEDFACDPKSSAEEKINAIIDVMKGLPARRVMAGGMIGPSYSVDGEYGPGHNSFFTCSDGELMIAYHAETSLTGMLRCDGIRRVHFRPDGTPYFGLAASEDLVRASVSSRIITGQYSNA